MAMETVITISRQYGSGGREIGKKLADQLGVTVPTVSKWELGQRTPELERVFRMTLIFGVPIEEIVQRTESA